MKLIESYYYRILLSFVIATVLFILIFLSAYSISYLNYRGIVSQNDLIESSLFRMDEILLNESCDTGLLLESSERLDAVGNRLEILERRFGPDDERVLDQKKLYSNLEFKHLQIVQRYNKMCETGLDTMIFFYSNLNGKQGESERMGFIISSFKRRYAEVMVYSFDVDLDYILIDRLEEEYGVVDVPIVVINEKELKYIREIDDIPLNESNSNA